MLEFVKHRLRITSPQFDGELQGLIDACKIDLSVCGVKKIEDTDQLIRLAVSCYCAAYFGINNENAEKYLTIYDSIKETMKRSGDYNGLE